MDALNSNYSQFAANFASKLQQTAAPVLVGETEMGQEVSSASQVRVSESMNKVAYVASHPELAESANLTAEESTELLASTSEKIVSAETTCRGNRVMFDIYAVMALIQETSQELRNAQRDLRAAEVSSITSSIMAQADLQRTAALTQLIAGCVTAGISLTMLGVSAGGMIKGLSQTSARQNAAGLNAMKQQENLLACEGSPTAAKANYEGVKSVTPENIRTEVDAELAKANQPTPTETKIADCKANCEIAGKEVRAAEQKFGAAQSKLNDLQQNGGGSKEIFAAKTEVAAATKELKAANAKLTDANKALGDVMGNDPEGLAKSISNEKANQLGSVVDKYQAEFNEASSAALYEFEQTGKVSPEKAAAVEAAGQKLNYARASQVNTCAGLDPRPTEVMSSAFRNVSDQTAALKRQTETGTIEQQKAQIRFQAVGQSVMAVSQLGGAVGQGISGLFSAESTRLQADQKQAEEQLDQIKDLFANTQQVIQQSIQLFQSVTSKESQSIEDIIGGIKA